MKQSASIGLAVTAILTASVAAGAEDEPRPSANVRLVHPDEQCARFLALFEGARAPHPAAALAAWKRATGGRQTLGKPREALIALGNPDMIREWRTLDGAELVVRCDPADGHLRWFATVPGDDGTFAALATAIALTDGAREPPLGNVAVDRLGPPGAALMALSGTRVVAAGARDDLRDGLTRVNRVRNAQAEAAAIGSGIVARLDPDSLGQLGPLPRRRLAEGLRAAGCRRFDGAAGLEGEQVRLALTGTFTDRAPSAGTRAVEPGWLDVIPASLRLAAAFSVAIDPSPEAWDAAFSVLDRVERADPARAEVAALRTRVNLLTLPAGVQLEADLWPRLLGASGAVFTSPKGQIEGALLALHTTDADAARKIAHRVLPALAAAFRLIRAEDQPAKAADADAIVRLGQRDGRALTTAARGSTVLVGWGDVFAASLDARANPARSAGPAIRAGWSDRPPQRTGALWPGRVAWPQLAPPGSPLAEALNAAPPVLWQGRSDAQTTRDQIQWPGLRTTIRRFLEHLPLDPAPAPQPSR